MCPNNSFSLFDGISKGDWIQIASSIILGGSSLFISYLAYKYSFLKGAEINIFTPTNEIEVTPASRLYGMYEYLDLNQFVIMENIGFSTATIIKIEIKISFNFKSTIYNLSSKLTTSSDPSSSPYKLPKLLKNGETESFNLKLRINPKVTRSFENKKIGIDELKKFPGELLINLIVYYKDGRGKDKTLNSSLKLIGCKEILKYAQRED